MGLEFLTFDFWIFLSLFKTIELRHSIYPQSLNELVKQNESSSNDYAYDKLESEFKKKKQKENERNERNGKTKKFLMPNKKQ